MNVKGRITPLNFSRKERDKIKDRKIAAFMPILAMKRDEIKRKGHGGSLTSDRFQNNETVIAKGRYSKKKDMTVLTEIDLMSAMNAVINEDNIYILPSEKIILNNPFESEEESATKATEAVERFESSELSRKLFPDMAKIDQAKRMDEAGTFRTMAEITSGFKSPSARPIKLRGSTDKRIRAQIRGFKPTSSEVVSSKNARQLRDQIRTRIYNSYRDMTSLIGGSTTEITEEEIDNYLETTGISRETLIDGLLKGHEKYIDRTERTQKDFARIINAYHSTRLNNVPYLQKISPYLGTQSASKGLNEKFLNSIAPTAVNMTEPHVIHYIFDLGQNQRPPATPKYNAWWDFLLGEVDAPKRSSISTPVFVKQNAEKSANRLLTAFGQNENAAAKAIFDASTKAFGSKTGVIDIGFVGFGVGDELIASAKIRNGINGALDRANRDRVNGESFDTLFAVEGVDGYDNKKNMKIKKRKMDELVKMQLAFPINGTNGFYLVPLFSGGFRKQPKGWSSKWVIPTMQILDEYAEVAQDPEGGINGLDLLFIIAARAKSLYNYDLKEAETLLLYTMLNPVGEAKPAEEPSIVERVMGGEGVTTSRASIMPYGTKLSQDILDQDKKINFFNKLATYHQKKDGTEEIGKKNKKHANKLWEDIWEGDSGDRPDLPSDLLGKIGKAGIDFQSNKGPVFGEFNKWTSNEEALRKEALREEEEEDEDTEEDNQSSILTGDIDGEEALGMVDITDIMELMKQYEAVAGSPLKLHEFWKRLDDDEILQTKLIKFLMSQGKTVDFGEKPTKKNPPLPASLQANGLNHAKALQDMVAAEHGQEYVIMQKGNVYIVVSQKEIGKANKKGFNTIPQSKPKFSKSFQNKFARGEVKSNPANILPIFAGTPSSKFTNKGLVSSEVQIGRNFVKDIGETVQGIYRGLIGGRTSMAEKRMAMAIASMQQELSDRAKAKGGNAVANLKVDYEMISQTVTLTLIATADAIKMTKPPKSNPVESVSVAQTFPHELDGRFEARDVGDFVAEHKGYVIETEISSNEITMKGSGTITLMENAMVTFEQMKDPSNVIKYRDTMSQGFNPIFIIPDDDAQVIKTKGKSLLIEGYVNDGWRTFHKHGPSHLAQKISEVEELFSYGYDRANFIDGGYSLSQICRDKRGFYLWDGNEKLRFKTLNYIGKQKWGEAIGYENYLRKVPEVKNKLKKLKDEELGAYAVKNPPPTIHYPTLALVRETPKSSIKLILIHYKQELYDANVKKQMESMKKALDTKLKNSKKNPITAECQKCGHKQKMKSLNDKCEKCGHGKFKSGEYTSRAESSPKLKCTYKKTKRSKPCGSEVKLMKNGRIYKCHDCGAKYEMR